MPRGGWLAIGSVLAALAVPAMEGRLGITGSTGLVVALAVAAGAVSLSAGRRGRRRSVLPLMAGAVVVSLRILAGGPPVAEAPIPEGDGPWRAVVIGAGSPRDGQQTATLGLEPAGPNVAATLPRYPDVAPGDRVSVGGQLEPLPADDGGYGTYLRRIGVAATIRARTLERLGTDGSPAGAVERARRASGEALTRALPEPEAGLAAGILIGLRDRVDRDLAAAFTTAGVSHVVAISGWNIAIVAALVAGLLRGRIGRRGRSVVTLGAIVLYTVAAGASASVVRAAVMAAVVLLARELGRAGAAATALGWAVVLLLLLDPGTVGDPGFQLSVLATGGLIAWATSLTQRLRAWRGGRLPGWLAESLGVSFAAEAATLPVVLAGFGRFALLAPAVNLVVVPLVPPAMAAGTLALVGGWLTEAGAAPVVGTVLGLPGWLVLAALVAVVRTAAAVPFASIALPAPWGLVLGSLAGVVVLLVASGRLSRLRRIGPRTPAGRWAARRDRPEPETGPGRPSAEPRSPRTPGSSGPGSARAGTARAVRSSRAARVLAVAVAGCLSAVVIVAANRPDGRVRVTVLDVGQGDAILVEGGRGGRLLVDGGPDPDRLLVALDARLPPWDRRIDLLVLSHPHEDHVAGLALLLNRYRIGRTFEPGMIGPGPGYRAWQAALRRLGLAPGRLATGDRFGLDQIRFRVLWPDPDAVPLEPADGGTAINNVSIVLLGEVGRQRFLLAGDIEEGIDPTLVGRGLPRVDLLKIAHHGSRTSSTDSFLDAVRPRVAVASAGTGNPYGHPTKATLDRVAAHGAQVLRTDQNGSVEITLDGAGELGVRPERRGLAAGNDPTASDGRPAIGAPPTGRPIAARLALGAAGEPGVARVGSTIVAQPRVAFTCGIPLATG